MRELSLHVEEMKCKSHNRFGPLFNKRFVRACLHLGAAIKRDVEHKEVQHEHVYEGWTDFQ